MTEPAAATAPQTSAATEPAGLVTYAPLVIVPEFGTSITTLTGTGSDPTTAAEVESAIDAAIDYYETHWTSDVPVGTVINGAAIDTVTISIAFDYGTLHGRAMTYRSGASQSMYGLVTAGNGRYATLYSTLSDRLPDLPATDPTGGNGTFLVTQAQSQLLGIDTMVANPAGYVGLNTIRNGVRLNWNLSDQSIAGEIGAVSAIEHEISEILGRSSDLGLDQANTYTLFDLYRFKAPDTPALTPGAADYFSLNNGTTALGYFNNHNANHGDAGDWASGGIHKVPADAFDGFLSPTTAGTISNLDSLELGAIGLRPAPRTLLWTGGQSSSFTTAADWYDLTNGLASAQMAPTGTDIAQFLTSGGAISGTGTVAALQFGGVRPWDVTNASSLTAAGAVTVGAGGSGNLLISGAAEIVGLGAGDTVSGNAGSGASVTVTGTGSGWRSAGELTIGSFGAGRMTVSNGASLAAAATSVLPAVVLGQGAGSAGALTVAGAGSLATLAGELDVGQDGSGSLSITNQGTVITGGMTLAPDQGIDIGEAAGSAGTIAVSGGLLNNTGRFVVGDAGVGILSISSGTVITSPGGAVGLAGLAIAGSASASGSSVNVSGSQSRLAVTGTLDVGSGGAGALRIAAGATVSAASLDVGAAAGGIGRVDLTGSTTELSISQAVTVAGAGSGRLAVLGGATLEAASLTIGASSGRSGAAVVAGAGSVIQLSGALNVGTSLQTGNLTIGPGAAVHAAVVNLQGQVVLQGGLLDPTTLLVNQGATVGGIGTVEASDVIVEAVIQANASPDHKREVVCGTVLGGGTLTCNGTMTTNAPGLLQINTGGTLELQGAVLNGATTCFADNLTPADRYTLCNSEVDVRFTGAAGELLLDDVAGFGGTITAFHRGDALVIAGGTLSGLHVDNGNTLLVADRRAGVIAVDKLVFASPIAATAFDIVNGDTVQMACFASGTRIETADGLTEVQDLRVGDTLQTVLGDAGQIVWTGSRAVDCRRHVQPDAVWPVRIARGAVAENVPQRDLLLSPDHAIYLGGVLIPVKLLINASTIRQIKVDHIVYHHVELAQHDVILAEGLAAETYLDVGDRHIFSGAMVSPPYADFPARLREMAGCAPIVLTGQKLRSIRFGLAARARQTALCIGALRRHRLSNSADCMAPRPW